MTVSERDIKTLWGGAAGRCSHPDCRADLIRHLNEKNAYNLGEMAHIVARSDKGPRSRRQAEDNTYANLILLCPTHHTEIDKAPELYPADLLMSWKIQHERWVMTALSDKKCEDNEELRAIVCSLLHENFRTWKNFGPESEVAKLNPHSGMVRVWTMRRAGIIVPNNRKIINVLATNGNLLDAGQREAYDLFSAHAEAYELHVKERIDGYPRFPLQMRSAYGCEQ